MRFERVSADENASLDGEARGLHSISRRIPAALIRMARICSAGERRQIVAAIRGPEIAAVRQRCATGAKLSAAVRIPAIVERNLTPLGDEFGGYETES